MQGKWKLPVRLCGKPGPWSMWLWHRGTNSLWSRQRGRVVCAWPSFEVSLSVPTYPRPFWAFLSLSVQRSCQYNSSPWFSCFWMMPCRPAAVVAASESETSIWPTQQVLTLWTYVHAANQQLVYIWSLHDQRFLLASFSSSPTWCASWSLFRPALCLSWRWCRSRYRTSFLDVLRKVCPRHPISAFVSWLAIYSALRARKYAPAIIRSRTGTRQRSWLAIRYISRLQ
jgi:hypothetical protein